MGCFSTGYKCERFLINYQSFRKNGAYLEQRETPKVGPSSIVCSDLKDD